jgi:glycosyltransferase involved in cell wall biosynthesis
MRILLFHFAELGALGGVEIAVLKFAEALAKRGSVPAIVEIAPEQKPLRSFPNGTPVWSVTSPSYPRFRRPRSWASFARAAWQFQAILRSFRPDIVHVHYPIAQCFPAVGVSYFPHSWKMVVTVHGSDIRVAPFQEPTIWMWQRRLFDRADAITAVSQALLEDAAQLYENLRPKASVVHNGVGPQWFELPVDPEGGKNYALFAGRLHEVKGVDVLLAAWKSVAAAYPNTELWIAGDGPERENLTKIASDLGIASRVRFLGSKKQEELPTLYRDARVVAMPSRREGLPIGLLEAGACGAVCVCTRIPGIPEIVEDGVNGFLVEPNSPSALASALLRVLGEPPELLRTIREAARKRILASYSEERMVSSYLELFHSLCPRG